MAINLQKPLGTDVYSIGVFNTNSETIETAINNLQTNVENLNDEILKKLPYTQITSTSFNIDTMLNDGIYYLYVRPTGTLPNSITDTLMILLSIKNSSGSQSTQILLNSKGTNYRTVTSSSVNAWLTLEVVEVIDNLQSTSSTSALSANQGRLLDINKLNILYYNVNSENNTINLNNVVPGIHVCNGTSVSGTIPTFSSINSTTATNNKFILESYGIIGETSVIQRLSDVTSTTQGSRFGYLVSSNWVWTDWLVSGDSIHLEFVDL